MKMNVTKKIGKRNYSFLFEGNDLWETVMNSQKLSFGDVDNCELCSSDDLRLYAYQTKEGYNYIKIMCNKCRASVTFGQPTADPKTFYLRKDANRKLLWAKYEETGSGNTAGTQGATGSEQNPADNTDYSEVPF